MGGSIRILLVDDHLIARESLAFVLKHEHDLDIIGEATNGQMAVELTQQLHPDVVIMDARMPVMNGVEATRRIVSEHPEIRVIGFSMHSKTELGTAMEKAGAAACVSKSDPIEILIDAIRHCFSA